MQPEPQSPKSFCDLSRESLALLTAAQRLLLTMRARSRMPRDPRSEGNLKRIERLAVNGNA